jgi:hypothetical protein
MTYEARATTPRPPNSPYPGGSSSAPSGRDVRRLAGAVIMAVGALYAMYKAGSGLSRLVTVCLDNFGSVLLAGTINFIVWTILVFPIGGLVANTLCAATGIMLFGGIPAFLEL